MDDKNITVVAVALLFVLEGYNHIHSICNSCQNVLYQFFIHNSRCGQAGEVNRVGNSSSSLRPYLEFYSSSCSSPTRNEVYSCQNIIQKNEKGGSDHVELNVACSSYSASGDLPQPRPTSRAHGLLPILVMRKVARGIPYFGARRNPADREERVAAGSRQRAQRDCTASQPHRSMHTFKTRTFTRKSSVTPNGTANEIKDAGVTRICIAVGSGLRAIQPKQSPFAEFTVGTFAV
ncbi:hypothetical protein EVAR_5628_1 [Eumeta japonica]|uniref:Uncharacterized protein n=1 Tax=Eumeta variegata TaxID=151549 RepID=A0A4C1TA59_EUMVA|nr:hypothetical protein EVAR_5628_1 [Eumeta japonica]